MTKRKNLRPFFSFYGGKWRNSKQLYPAPTFGTLAEPFAGSAGYATRYYECKVVLCDLDPVIAGVWDYLIKVSPNELLEIPDVPLDGEVDDLHLIPEAQSLVGFWLHRGAARPSRQPSAWMRSGKWPGSFWGARVRNTIASQVDLIRHWKIHNVPYEQTPVEGPATWFIDPPYQVAGRHYRHGSRAIDYDKLANWCKSRPGQTIVCEAQSAIWLPFEARGTTRTTSINKTRSEEASWVQNRLA